jgi:beta-lactamase regulating signal transducer with metallopeptidase domain
VIAPTVIASMRARRSLGDARLATGDGWSSMLSDVCAQLGIRRDVRVFLAAHVSVPMTWGAWRPVVALPAAAEHWDDGRRRMVLMHELAHVRSADWLSNLVARIVCALFWFHPGVWLLARALRQDCELACDDRVIASGVRRSDYAELLVHAAAFISPDEPRRGVALALSRRGGLRARLAAVLDVRHDVRPLARGWAAAAAVMTLSAAMPMSVVQLAPTRGVLTTLMLDTQWESRAYAVLGLAQRADSVAVARNAAEADPNPSVRAWARYALGDHDSLGELQALLRAR